MGIDVPKRSASYLQHYRRTTRTLPILFWNASFSFSSFHNFEWPGLETAMYLLGGKMELDPTTTLTLQQVEQIYFLSKRKNKLFHFMSRYYQSNWCTEYIQKWISEQYNNSVPKKHIIHQPAIPSVLFSSSSTLQTPLFSSSSPQQLDTCKGSIPATIKSSSFLKPKNFWKHRFQSCLSSHRYYLFHITVCTIVVQS